MTKSSFRYTSGSEVKTSRPIEIVYTDGLGTIHPDAEGVDIYVLKFVDDYSGFVDVYKLIAKSQLFERFKAFRIMVETQTDCFIKRYVAKMVGSIKLSLQQKLFRFMYPPPEKRAVLFATEWVSK